MVRVALAVPPRFAVMTAPPAAGTALVVTVNVVDVLPAGTVTLAGTTAEALLLDRVTAAPPPGAAPLNVTVAVEPEPPVTAVGFSDSELTTTWGVLPEYTAWYDPEAAAKVA
jgi:hypothetical protein